MIEAYGKGGLVPYLVESFPVQFLNDLLEQTVELRRDPKEREEEYEREQAQKWLKEHSKQTLVFQSATGEQKTVNVKDFMWSDDDDEN
ncbi:hypothetical protein [Nostoc punctiforme]|uniref:Uncharacterized protein n=2 Tax=Nostoc punctiforme TaxID=272131 RepID=B2ITB8_NOSP7|nr:hypothetical protein [Nostoc punctiforme]ACC81149.1 hypothetical protein Npun_R2595 [Nostoc punctiforme PCC 73102]RCJ29200.1 hypothetical protein A6769_35995 [Nostoc punctiforme NIES-2108]